MTRIKPNRFVGVLLADIVHVPVVEMYLRTINLI